MPKIFLSFFIFIFLGFAALTQQTFIYCGTLIDGISEEPKKEMTIIIENNIIKSINKGYTEANSIDNVIDLKNKTVLPGLWDMHVHIETEGGPGKYINRFTNNDADVAYDAAVYARTTLMAGFTTVRDLGGSGVNISLRKAINDGKVIGPRIYTAGKAIATTGGHADPTNGYNKKIVGDPGPIDGVVNGPDEATKAVRQQYKNGADCIKITATAGVLSLAKDGSGPQFQMDELEAIVKTSKEYGFVTAAHAHGAEGMKRAVLAGINTIEHGSFMTEEIMDLMIEKGTWYVPTLTAGQHVAEKAEIDGYYPEIVTPKAKEIGPQIEKTFAKAYKKGVNIMFGTDAGVFPHGENAREFDYMVEAGMKPMEAIKSATSIPAKVMGDFEKVGSIEQGKFADIVAVSGDPLENIKVLENISFVMKDGVVYKN